MPQAKPAVTTASGLHAMHNWPTTAYHGHLTALTLCGSLRMTSLPLESHSVLLNSLDREVPAQAASAWLHRQHKHGYDSIMFPSLASCELLGVLPQIP